jgi:hypothetical protein
VSGTVGPLVAPWNVEQAALTTLRDHLFIYLAEVERKNGLDIGAIPRPPSDASFYGGIDADSFQQDLTPSVVVSCNPTGDTIRDPDGYLQAYDLQVAAVVIGNDETDGRMLAGLYAAACAGVVAHNGSLGGLAQSSRLVSAPAVEFPDPDERRLVRGTCGFHTWVLPILSEDGDPGAIDPPDQELPDLPTVQTTDLVIVSEGVE